MLLFFSGKVVKEGKKVCVSVTHILLLAEGLRVGSRLASMISLKSLLPTALASCQIEEKKYAM